MVLYGVGMSYLVDSPQRLREEMMTVAGSICGWPEHETNSRLSSVFSRAEAAARGKRIDYLGGHRDPRYRYKDSTLVEMLTITEDEMRSLPLRHLVTDHIKRERDRERKINSLRAVGAVPRATYLANSLSRTKPWDQKGVSRRTWERRRARNVASTAVLVPAVATPSGCMVAEPKSLGGLRGLRPAFELEGSRVLQLRASTTASILIQRKGVSDLFGGRARPRLDLETWSSGVMPPAVRAYLRDEIKARGLRQSDVALSLGISRTQLVNILRGRFRASPRVTLSLKAFAERLDAEIDDPAQHQCRETGRPAYRKSYNASRAG
jgi:Helix-turn-helix